MIRIVIDTNLWVAALLSTNMRNRIEKILSDERIEIIATHELLFELDAVLQRPKFNRFFSSEQRLAYLQLLKDRLTLIESHSVVDLCRDPNDNFLLAISQDGDCDFLISGDNDLLSLINFGATQIVTISAFEVSLSPPNSQ